MLGQKINEAISVGQRDAQKHAQELGRLLEEIIDNQNEQAKALMAIWSFLRQKYPTDKKMFDNAEKTIGIRMEVE